MVAALNPLRAKASLILSIAHRLCHSTTTRSTRPRRSACRNSLTSKTSTTTIKKKKKVRTIPNRPHRSPKSFEAVLEAICGVALQPLPHRPPPEPVDISRGKSEARCCFGLLLCAPTRFSLFPPISTCSLPPSRTTSQKFRALPWHIVQMR